MVGAKDKMHHGEIEERFLSAIEENDMVRIVVDGNEYTGKASFVDTELSSSVAVLGIDTEDGANIKIKADISPSEPDVGISSRYPEEILAHIDNSKHNVDALQFWSEQHDDWL
jgi:hypothetical protein